MPLPQTDITWPPQHLLPFYSKMAEWAAWYSGEPSRIIDVYSAVTSSPSAIPWWRFWSRARVGRDGAQRALLHVPLASDLAATSGALLFGEPPLIRVRAAREDDTPAPDKAAGTPAKKPQTPEQRAEARLLEIVEEGDIYSRLVEAAESAAAIGGVYIYPVWDKDLRDFPIMAVAQSDMAIPEFRHGFLTAVTFHRTVETRGRAIYRHVERHEVEGTGESRKAVVLNALYLGTEDRLGLATTLGVSDTTANLIPRVELPFSELDVEYVPNIRPNRLWRASSLGVADIQGSETLLDALDETYASWMRDVRLAKARILVPREYLRPDPENKNVPAFDIDQEIYVGMDMEPGASQDSRSMLAHQFAIRFEEHRETARDLVERIVSNAGYAPQTLGTSTDASRTGTALRITEHKTLLTLRRKSGWWRTAVASTLYKMMLIDREVFGSTVPAIRPTVKLSDSIIDNPLELAQTALALKTAESASVETRVRIVRPDWSEAEVDAEVKRITDEVKAAKPKVTTGQFGAPHTDAATTGSLPTTPQAGGPAPSNPPPASPPLAPNAPRA